MILFAEWIYSKSYQTKEKRCRILLGPFTKISLPTGRMSHRSVAPLAYPWTRDNPYKSIPDQTVRTAQSRRRLLLRLLCQAD